ncbi:guanine-1-methyltransferase-domain-containing protein [Ganoderma leucocontextum]|nr:guanine-1-methyltransferase-domain-containing protein [Ganoderma leucocontextum]
MSGDTPSDAPASSAAELAPPPESNAPDPGNEPNPTIASTDAGTSPAAEPLSKKAQKKLAKSAYLAERKKERRAVEKERKKEKRREFAQKRDAGELDADELERERKRRKTEQGASGPRVPFGARIVVDLGFDAKMTENEVKSLTSQLAYTYSANKKAVHSFGSLLFTSLDGKTKVRMDAINNSAYKRWVGAEWWEEGYERLWERKPDVEECTPEVKVEEKGGKGTEAEDVKGKETSVELPKQQQASRAEKGTVVYLTADSEEELTELKEGETYIVGGIVDHNRYKNLCLNKSKEHGIRSARLPIGTYLAEMRTRKVLTVNQTFEILLKWIETRDWEQALHSVMPKRKFNAEGRRRGGGAASSKDGDSVIEDEGADGEERVLGGGGDVEVVDVAALEGEIDDDKEEAGGSTVVMES